MADNTELDAGSGGDVIATDDIGGVKHQRVKVEYGADGSATDVSSTNPLPVREQVLDGRFKVYEDTSFVTGDSPVTHDVNTDLGRDGRRMEFFNDGSGSIGLEVSNDGATFSDSLTVKNGERITFEALRIDSVRVTWIADSSYRLLVW